MLEAGDWAPDVVLQSVDGDVRTTQLWAHKPVVLSFQRHFNCWCTRDQLSTLRVEHHRILAAGGEVVAVLMGTPQGTVEFCSERAIPYQCLADPSQDAYRAFHIPRAGPSKWLFGPRALGYYARQLRRGIGGGGAPPGQDIRQMPGTFVIDRSGKIRMAHYSRDVSDVVSVDDVLAALGA